VKLINYQKRKKNLLSESFGKQHTERSKSLREEDKRNRIKNRQQDVMVALFQYFVRKNILSAT
jgi:hypothetical protein